MKKLKLLGSLMGVFTIPTIITPLASCSCNNGSQISNTITLVTTQKEWKNPTGGSISIEFNLSKELGTNEELTGPTFPADSGLHEVNASFDGDATWDVTGKKAVATMKFKDFSGGSYITADKINFNIENKSTKQVISKATLTNFKVYWESEVIHVTGVTLDKPTLNLNIGDEETLTPTIAPVDATNQEVTWSSDPESVATVDDGVVTAVAEGTATITCTSVDNPNAKATCTVTVNPQMTMFSWFAELYNILLTDTLYPTNTKQYAKENISLKIGGEAKTIENVEYDFFTKTLPQQRCAKIVYKKDGKDKSIDLFTANFLMQIIEQFESETVEGVKYSKKNGIYSYINKNEGSSKTTKEISFDKNGYLLCWDDATLFSDGKIEFTYNGDPQPLQTITQEYWAKACKSAISINATNFPIPGYYSYWSNPIVQYNKDQIGLKFGEQASTINSIEYAKDASDIWKGTLKYKKDGIDNEMLVLGKDLESKLPTVKESEGVIYTIDDKNGFVYENKTATTGLSKISFNKYGYYTGETNAESKDAPTVVTYDGIPLKTCNITYSATDNEYKIDYSPSFMSENENIIFNVTLDGNHSVNTFYFVDAFSGSEAVPVTNVSCPAGWTYNSETNKFTANTPVSTGTLQFKVSIPKTYPKLNIKLVNE